MRRHICCTALLLVGLTGLVPFMEATAALTNAPYRMKVSFPGFSRPGALTNFPALIVLNQQVHGFLYSQFASPFGADLRFSATSEAGELPFEIESWDTNGDSYVWVQVPALSNGASCYAHWGDPAATIPPSYTTNGAVWTAPYEAVLHLNDAGLGDSSANGFDGQNFGSTATPGLIANARAFNKAGNQYINCGSGLDISNRAFTVSAWAKRDQAGAAGEGYIVAHGMVGPPDRMGLHLGFRGGGEADLFAFGFWGDDLNSSSTYPDTSDWHLWTTTYDPASKQQRIYFDGSLVDLRTTVDHYRGSTATDLRIGSRFDNVAFDGNIDEVRISQADRSSNWVWATYVNAVSNTAFTDFGFIAHGPPPYVANDGASEITPHTAHLNGSLLTTGQAPTSVSAYWGEHDGGTVKSAWDHAVDLGVQDEGPVHAAVSGLKASTMYSYRYYVTNAFGAFWATETSDFMTQSPQLVPTKFSHRMKIRFDGYTKDETLTNFPLLVVLHAGLPNFSYSDFASPQGGDLRFTDEDGATLLNSEIDRWDTGGNSYIWVQVPALNSSTCIYAYWGRPGGTTAPASSTNGMTWSEHYRAVLHLNTNLLDSTPYKLDGTNFGSFDDVGLIGRSRDFNDLFGHHILTGPGLDISNKSFSVSAWSKRFTAHFGASDYLLSHGSPNTNDMGLHFGFVDPNTIRFAFWGDDLGHFQTNLYADTTEWRLMTATFDANTRRQTFYFDGVEMASRIADATYQGSSSTILRIGVAHNDAGSYYDGHIDEVRVSDTQRSSNWVWACWLNQKSNTSFSTYLPAEKPWAVLPELDQDSFTHQMKICFDGYTKTETLLNFPLLVHLHEGLPGFSYASFASPSGADLRFTDANGTSELSYEIERWDPAGHSYVWVRVPALANGDCIYAYWGQPIDPTPPDLGLKLWLKADSGVQTNGSGGVTNWVDQSGNGNDVVQSVLASIPTRVPNAINGKPVVRFDGDDQLIKSLPSLPPGAKPRTVLMVTKSDFGAGDLYPLSYGTAAVNESFGLDLGDDIRVVGFGNDYDTGFDGDTGVHLYVLLYDGGTIEPYEDGALGTPSARVYATTLDALYVGSFTDGAFNYDGDVAEILVYDRELGQEELNRLGYYLEQKYGLSTSHTESPVFVNDGSTWAQDYQTVLHLDNDFLDSTYLHFNATNFGSFDAAGQVSRGRNFDKNFNDHLQGGPGLELANKSFSLSTWAKRAASGPAADGFFLSHGSSGISNQGLHFGFRGGGEAETMTFAFWADDLNSSNTVYADTSDWHLWTATFDTNTRLQMLYRDGVAMATRTANANYQGSPSTILRVGELFGGQYYGGGMDELRIADAQRSSNWVWACWFSQQSNDAFSTYLPAGPVDRDEDGLPDYWESLYYGNPTNAEPTAHDDSDEFNNREEYIADTIPIDGNSYFLVDGFSNASPFRAFFDGSTGRVYTLQYNTNLPAGIWSDVLSQTHVPGFGANSFLIDTNTAGPRNYRLGVKLP